MEILLLNHCRSFEDLEILLPFTTIISATLILLHLRRRLTNTCQHSVSTKFQKRHPEKLRIRIITEEELRASRSMHPEHQVGNKSAKKGKRKAAKDDTSDRQLCALDVENAFVRGLARCPDLLAELNFAGRSISYADLAKIAKTGDRRLYRPAAKKRRVGPAGEGEGDAGDGGEAAVASGPAAGTIEEEDVRTACRVND
jgi:hypothetical protein